MADSVLPALQQKLFDLVDAHAPISTVPVFWGPNPSEPLSEEIEIGFGEEGHGGEAEREWTVLRAQPLPQQESFRTEIAVTVWRASGEDLKPAYTRAWEIVNDVDEAIRADVSLGDTVWSCRAARLRGRWIKADQQRGYRIFMAIVGDIRI